MSMRVVTVSCALCFALVALIASMGPDARTGTSSTAAASAPDPWLTDLTVDASTEPAPLLTVAMTPTLWPSDVIPLVLNSTPASAPVAVLPVTLAATPAPAAN